MEFHQGRGRITILRQNCMYVSSPEINGSYGSQVSSSSISSPMIPTHLFDKYVKKAEKNLPKITLFD